MKQIAKEKLYWICQLGGWFLFITMDLVGYLMLDGYRTSLAINAMINYVLCILLTHLYRLFLIRSNWLSLPLVKLIPRGILAVVLMASILTSINIPLDRYTYPILQQIELTPAVFLSYFFNLSKFVLLWSLTYHLFQYWEISLNAEKEKYQLQAAAKENAYLNLKNQLNPHFLFNSLNSIRTLVDIDPILSKQAINQLSSLLRSSLYTGKNKTILLKDELQTVKDYLAIEKIRFDDRLNWEIQVDDDLLDYAVPPMMLQTLVENGVKHGISSLKEGGLISIKATVTEQKMTVIILNSGVYNPSNTNGLGLSNTQQRLSLLYDNEAEVNIKNLPNQLVQTTLIIPV